MFPVSSGPIVRSGSGPGPGSGPDLILSPVNVKFCICFLFRCSCTFSTQSLPMTCLPIPRYTHAPCRPCKCHAPFSCTMSMLCLSVYPMSTSYTCISICPAMPIGVHASGSTFGSLMGLAHTQQCESTNLVCSTQLNFSNLLIEFNGCSFHRHPAFGRLCPNNSFDR